MEQAALSIAYREMFLSLSYAETEIAEPSRGERLAHNRFMFSSPCSADSPKISSLLHIYSVAIWHLLPPAP